MKIVQKRTEYVNKYKHKHCYVYTFLQKRKDSPIHEITTYHLLTDIEGPHHKENKKWLEQGLRMAYGYMPKSVKYKHDKYR